jgi:hypothetical protein
VAVSLSTALILIVFSLLWMVIMFFGAYGNDAANAVTGLVITSVLLITIIVIASIGSGWLAHVLQTRSGISP